MSKSKSRESKNRKKFGKYIWWTHERIVEPTAPLHPKYRKKQKKQRAKKMSSIPSGGRSRGGQLRWACLRWPRGGDAIARNRYITVWVWIGSRVEHKFTWLFFFVFFCILGARGSVGSTILSWVHHIFLPKKFGFKNKKELQNEAHTCKTCHTSNRFKKNF